jgi:signal peptidase I
MAACQSRKVERLILNVLPVSVLCGFLLLQYYLLPYALGYHPTFWVAGSGSMEPAINIGDLMVAIGPENIRVIIFIFYKRVLSD